MRLFETPLSHLGSIDRAAWRELAHRDGVLLSPYLLPEFADLVDAERHDVRVVIAEEDGAPVGYFACHAPVGGVVRPVGAPLSDYQGFAARPGFKVQSKALLDVLGAEVLVYDNWRGEAPGKVRDRGGSSILDLGQGADAWLANRRQLHRVHFKKMSQRKRKAEREYGEVRVVFGDPLGERYDALKAWKSQQFRNSGLIDLFSVRWTEGVLARASARAFGPFRGLTASLYLGDRLAAVETGLVAGGVYHSWIPAYDKRFASVSPGLLLMHGIIEAAESMGISRIDLGKGEQAYKAYYTDYEAPLSSGRAVSRGLSGLRIKSWEMAEQLGGALPGPLAAAPLKLRRRWAQTAAIEPGYVPRLKRFAAAFADAPKRIAV
jgi:CelD/BcsL family acetyltransferase involved in cellulose biosynthesis